MNDIQLDYQKYTILIIDDNPTNLGVIVDYLKGFGFNILVATDGELGIKRAKFGHPDLILLDVMMPGIDGFETCRRLKAHEKTQDIPVIFMTTLTETEDKVTGFEVGAVDYVTKPIQQEEVFARVITHLKIRDLTRSLQEQNERLQQANSMLARRAVQLEASSALGQRVISILNLDELLVQVVALIQVKFGYYFVGVWLLTEHQRAITLQTGAGKVKAELPKVGFQIALDVPLSIIAWVCQTREAYLSNDVKIDTKYLALEYLTETMSELTLPLQVGDEVIGVLDIQGDKINAFDADDKIVLQTLANQIAIAIRNARLYELEKKLRQVEEERARDLAELNASKDKFFSIVAHDLKGPFQPLLGLAEFLQMVAETAPPAEILEMSETIYRSAKNVYNLLENLLEWARMQMGRIAYQPTKLNLREIVEQTTNLLAEKDIVLQNNVPDELFVDADENMLDMVIRNLIGNALKFTPSGGRVSVEVRDFELEDNQKSLTPQAGGNGHLQNAPLTAHLVEISVSDTGVGMSQKDMDKLFRIEVHHSTTGTAQEQGTGLGLIISKEMVQKNGGRIWVESELGKGTTMKFTMPLNSSTHLPLTDLKIKNQSLSALPFTHSGTSEGEKLVSPPSNEMDILYELAIVGDMQGIQERANGLKQLDELYIPFANKLHDLARNFEEQAVLALIEQNIE